MDGPLRISGVRPPSPACTPSSPTRNRSGVSCMSFWPKSSARRRLVSPSKHWILSRLGPYVHCSFLDCFWGGRRRILGSGSLSHRRSVRLSFLFFFHLLIWYALTSQLQSPRVRLNRRCFNELYGHLRRIILLTIFNHLTKLTMPTRNSIYLVYNFIAIYTI